MQNILITGGTGMIGTRLTEMLLEQGYEVSYMSRGGKSKNSKIKTYLWDLKNYSFDRQAIEKAHAIIHLAGSGVADSRWTEERKEEIRSSRVDTSEMLLSFTKRSIMRPKVFISASGIGFYGADTGDEPITEESEQGDDFIADVSGEWELYPQGMKKLDIRTVIMRIGIVLSKKGGALPKIALPVKFGVGAALGSGEQYQSWIHIDDLCRLFIKALKDDRMEGIYNAVAPNPVTNAQLTKAIAKTLYRPLFLPKIPAGVLKIVLGEMSSLVLGGNKVINKRIAEETNFQYQFPDIQAALKDIYA